MQYKKQADHYGWPIKLAAGFSGNVFIQMAHHATSVMQAPRLLGYGVI
jgi:hypothetical protein